MNRHQMAWLSAHTERTEAWLRDRLSDGFDVHHIDHDRENNDPSNLILVESGDHMGLHGINVRHRLDEGRKAQEARTRARTLARKKAREAEAARPRPFRAKHYMSEEGRL